MLRVPNALQSASAAAGARRQYVAIATRSKLPLPSPPRMPAASSSSLLQDSVYSAAMQILDTERTRLAAAKTDLEHQLRTTAAEGSAAKDISAAIHELNLDLGHTSLELQTRYLTSNHASGDSRKTTAKKVNSDSDVELATLADLDWRRFQTWVVPRLQRSADEFALFGDVFPKTPDTVSDAGRGIRLIASDSDGSIPVSNSKWNRVNVKLNFGHTSWEGCYGHPVPPNWVSASSRYCYVF